MQKTSKRRISVIVGNIVFVSAVIFLFLKDFEIRKPDNWSEEIILRANAYRGIQRVIEKESEATIFYYSDDPRFHPISIEKKDEDTFVVEFKKIR